MTSGGDPSERPGNRFVRRLVWTVAALAIIYVTGVALLYASQRAFIYPGWVRPSAPQLPGDSAYRVVWLRTSDGLKLRAFYRAPSSGKPVLLFFHGNGSSLAAGEHALAPLVADGYGALLPEYRGYGGNPGTPSEAGLYRDGAASTAWLRANGVAPEETVIIGYSLGSGVATQTAVDMHPRALILVAGLASMVQTVSDRLPFLPADLLVTERFDNAAKLPRLECPVLLIHGTSDHTVPVDNGLTLKVARPSATLRLVPGADHGVIFLPGTARIMQGWLSRTLNAKPGMQPVAAPPISTA